jgi:MFS transporter, ACS family, solute carrier family 17 (sodium-dependent inorganic phosphate cotransporter), member 5
LIVTLLALIIISLALLVATLLDSQHRTLIIACIIIAIGSCGPAWASFGVNHLDIGAHYAGILMGVSNCIGSTPGFLVPMLTGFIVQDQHVRHRFSSIEHTHMFSSILDQT